MEQTCPLPRIAINTPQMWARPAKCIQCNAPSDNITRSFICKVHQTCDTYINWKFQRMYHAGIRVCQQRSTTFVPLRVELIFMVPTNVFFGQVLWALKHLKRRERRMELTHLPVETIIASCESFTYVPACSLLSSIRCVCKNQPKSQEKVSNVTNNKYKVEVCRTTRMRNVGRAYRGSLMYVMLLFISDT